MNYAIIEFLENRLTPDLTIFEYGCGNSTLFFAQRVHHVTSVECDEGWYSYIKDSMPDNVSLNLVPAGDENYVKAIGAVGKTFDIVVVDAEDRVECMVNAPSHLSDRGVILLDDAARDQYQPGIEKLLSQGFRQLPFNGLKAGGIRSYRTTVFYRDGNCLGI